MNQVLSAISIVTKPIHSVYVKAFDANKYAAGIGFSSAITLALFFVMVILISLGDSGLREDTSVKLADVVMPERQIDTFLTEVDKPDKPEEQPEDIAQPELDLAPLTGLDVSIAKPKANFKAGGSFFRDGEYIPLLKLYQYIQEEHKKEELWDMPWLNSLLQILAVSRMQKQLKVIVLTQIQMILIQNLGPVQCLIAHLQELL